LPVTQWVIIALLFSLAFDGLSGTLNPTHSLTQFVKQYWSTSMCWCGWLCSPQFAPQHSAWSDKLHSGGSTGYLCVVNHTIV